MSEDTVDAYSVCYCGWAGIDSDQCVCGKTCAVDGCDEFVVIGSGRLNLCEFHLHFHLATTVGVE